jgi:hypothetical protein
VTNATRYVLELKDMTAGTATKPYRISSGSTTSYAIRLTAGHTYQWYVYAFDGSAESLASTKHYFTIHR